MFIDRHQPMKMYEFTPADLDYQHARAALHSTAMVHAEEWGGRVVAAFPKRHDTQTMANHMRAFAFSNEMQRLAFKEGLIAYNVEEGRGYKSEDALLAEFKRRPIYSEVSKRVD